MGISYGGLILHNIRDSLHSKFYGHGLHGETNQNSPVISINNHQQVLLAENQPTNHHQPQQHPYGLNQRGDYGSLPSSGHHSYGTDIDSNFKAGGINYHRRGGDSSYGSHSMGSDFGGGSSHHMMKQESYNHRHGPKFGYHHDNNMFGNTQGLGPSNHGIPASSSSSSSASASSSSGASSSSSSSSSTSISNSGVRPWNRPY